MIPPPVEKKHLNQLLSGKFSELYGRMQDLVCLVVFYMVWERIGFHIVIELHYHLSSLPPIISFSSLTPSPPPPISNVTCNYGLLLLIIDLIRQRNQLLLMLDGIKIETWKYSKSLSDVSINLF